MTDAGWINFFKTASRKDLLRFLDPKTAQWIIENRGSEAFERECEEILGKTKEDPPGDSS